MNSPKAQVEFVTRLAYNLEGLPGRLKLYFSQFLSFHFSKILSPEQIQHIENKKASRAFVSDEEMVQATANFTTVEKVWVIAALMILKSEAEAIDDRVFSLKMDAVIGNLRGLFGLGEAEQQILAEKKRLEGEALRFQNRKLIGVPVSIGPLALDWGLRWVVLLFAAYFHASDGFLIGTNVFYIPILVLILTWWTGKRNSERNRRMLETYGGESSFRLDHYLSTGQYTWLAFFLATGVFIGYLLPDQMHLFGFAGLTLLYFVCIRFFIVGRVDENELVKQLEGDDQNLQSLNRDENDEVIVGLETKLNSLTGRLEAYVLESALFGALTFSGFLQIMSSELVTFKALEDFAGAIFNSSRALIKLDETGFWSAAASLNNKVSLFSLVSVESLICSVFFLAVIASRLRFSNVADKVRTAINLAKVYNAKEEAFFQEEEFSERRSARLAALNAKVNEQLQATVDAMREVEPVMTYMQYFRNAGILVFLVILLSSTLFITSVVGWAFLALVFATYLYFNRQVFALSLNVTYLNLRIQFARQSAWLFVAAVSPFIFGLVVCNGLHWPGDQALVALGYFFVGLYIFLWLLFSAQVDDEFGDIEKNSDANRIGRWKFVKSMLAGLILFYCTAMGMKYLHLNGANALVMVSLSMLSILFYFVGYYLSKIRWLGVVMGGLMATFSIGILFKTLHLPGAHDMLIIGVITIGVLIPIIFWQRKKFHILFMKFCIAAFLIGVIFLSGIFNYISLAVSHRTPYIGEIEEMIDYQVFEKDVKVALEKSDRYIQDYGTRPGYGSAYRELIRCFRLYCREDVLATGEKRKDSVSMQYALLVARQSNKIQAMFGYNPSIIELDDVGMEADVLVALNRKEDAIEALRRIIAIDPPLIVREFLQAKVKEIEQSGAPQIN